MQGIWLVATALAAPVEARVIGQDRPADALVDRGTTLPRTPRAVGTPIRLFGGASLGRGLRFNNPYRLETVLGKDAQSLSATAPYVALEAGAVAGSGNVLHGVLFEVSLATEGIPQEVLSPAYTLWYRLGEHWMLRGRAGFPVVLEPDLNMGMELGAGSTYYLTAALGVTASVVGSWFTGAATVDSSRVSIPILSLQAGLLYEYEVLP